LPKIIFSDILDLLLLIILFQKSWEEIVQSVKNHQ
jgi:hypothetical protein